MRELRQTVVRHPVEAICAAVTAGFAMIAVFDLIRYAALGRMWPIATIMVVELLFVLSGVLAVRSNLPAVLVAPGVAGIVLGCTMNYAETTMFNAEMFVQAAIALIGAVAGTAVQIRFRRAPVKAGGGVLAAIAAIVVVLLAVWQGGAAIARSHTTVQTEIWDVPAVFSTPTEQEGMLERVEYETKAYATDERVVTKAAYVYLPYGYDESRQYDILYLMHGTGDDEAYWFVTHPENKTMVDRMIETGAIEPMIIVTPTFYVEDDCADGLDPLTYSFKEELRNDLMPIIESRYSTYAETADAAGFEASRDHRAFAGLSRGAVTTYHSAICGSLDWFSWFGTFSGSRTSADYFRETIQSDAFKDYPINYLYVTSGTFDFALPGQIEDYRTLLSIEPRLEAGVNTEFDIFPMRYHSAGNWHLALYNFLPRIFH